MSIGVLGPITFEVSADRVRTWQDAKRSAGARWATHEVFAGKPKKEFIGPGLATISLSVRLDLDRGLVPRDELRQMRAQMDTGAVLQFTVGGELVGDFVLRDVSEDWRRFSRNGVLTTAIVVLSLEEYQ
jgi:phage protein U